MMMGEIYECPECGVMDDTAACACERAGRLHPIRVFREEDVRPLWEAARGGRAWIAVADFPAPDDWIAAPDARQGNARDITDGCPRCGHPANAHSNAREDDYRCSVKDCACLGWLPSERPKQIAASGEERKPA
jgi:hypothetical protein